MWRCLWVRCVKWDLQYASKEKQNIVTPDVYSFNFFPSLYSNFVSFLSCGGVRSNLRRRYEVRSWQGLYRTRLSLYVNFPLNISTTRSGRIQQLSSVLSWTCECFYLFRLQTGWQIWSASFWANFLLSSRLSIACWILAHPPSPSTFHLPLTRGENFAKRKFFLFVQNRTKSDFSEALAGTREQKHQLNFWMQTWWHLRSSFVEQRLKRGETFLHNEVPKKCAPKSEDSVLDHW